MDSSALDLRQAQFWGVGWGAGGDTLLQYPGRIKCRRDYSKGFRPFLSDHLSIAALLSTVSLSNCRIYPFLASSQVQIHISQVCTSNKYVHLAGPHMYRCSTCQCSADSGCSYMVTQKYVTQMNSSLPDSIQRPFSMAAQWRATLESVPCTFVLYF